MNSKERRLNWLERRTGTGEVVAVLREGDELVKITSPVERRGERMTLEEFEREFTNFILFRVYYGEK